MVCTAVCAGAVYNRCCNVLAGTLIDQDSAQSEEDPTELLSNSLCKSGIIYVTAIAIRKELRAPINFLSVLLSSCTSTVDLSPNLSLSTDICALTKGATDLSPLSQGLEATHCDFDK